MIIGMINDIIDKNYMLSNIYCKAYVNSATIRHNKKESSGVCAADFLLLCRPYVKNKIQYQKRPLIINPMMHILRRRCKWQECISICKSPLNNTFNSINTEVLDIML